MEKNKIIDADEIWQVAFTYIKTVVDTVREPFLILDGNLRVLSANRTFYTIFLTTAEETEKKLVYKLGNGQWNVPKLKILLEDILPKNTHFDDFRVEHDFPQIGHKVMVINARKVFTPKKEEIIMMAIEDITKQTQLEHQLKEYTEKLAAEVTKKTTELEIRIAELEKINKLMVGRELKMSELKEEINDLKKKFIKKT
jgi:nitrogen-specific signal transduction histidine kinase